MNSQPPERSFPKHISALPGVFAFLSEALDPLTSDERARLDIAFAVEEFFTNMVKYTPESANDILIRIVAHAEGVDVVLENTDVEPFDVTRAPEADTTLPLDRRRPGGLGIQLSRELMDDIRYKYEDRRSIITLSRRLV
jgi:anti-sigma regulatory factor (Ser/Thr protein kinase)